MFIKIRYSEQFLLEMNKKTNIIISNSVILINISPTGKNFLGILDKKQLTQDF